MSFEEEVLDFGTSLSEYSALWQQYRRTGFNRTLDLQDKENSLKTDWALSHYYSIGADALRIVVKNLLAAGLAPPRRILDFPCGSGRVMRHMRAMFPDADDRPARHTQVYDGMPKAYNVQAELIANIV